MKLMNLFKQARDKDKVSRKEQNALPDKLGNLRAGNTGIVSPSGEVAAACLRIAHLRQLDLDIENLGEDKHLMFDLGLANEDVIAAKLEKVLPKGHILLREEQIPTNWKTANGTTVSGRPDIVICKVDLPESNDISHLSYEEQLKLVKPTLGLELKSVHSMWTAKDVLFGGKPKLSNVAQAAHYMWQLNVPYKLIYTAYSQLGQGMAGQGSGWIVKMFPKPGEKNSEFVEYSFFRKEKNPKTGKDRNVKVSREEYDALPWAVREYSIKHIRQFQMVYDLRIEQGTVQFKAEDSSEWKDTVIRIEDIERFYSQASQIVQTNQLGPRPSTIDLDGSSGGFSICDYCPLKATCDKHETSGYNKWLQEVQKISSSLDNK